MKRIALIPRAILAFFLTSFLFLSAWAPRAAPALQISDPISDPDPTPPNHVVKLIFIHHSVGENWLTDGYGNLGMTLDNNNYFVSDTNYGWGPNSIGDRTDIPNWPEWFRSAGTPTYMDALFNESDQHSSYTRTLPNPGGKNEIIMFKSCFPNSNLEGNPDDPPDPTPGLTVGHAKYVYNELLKYFRTRPDKLFVVITAPPLRKADTTTKNAANARAFNNWLVNDWLSTNGYRFHNVAVFDFYNILTASGAHHRYNAAKGAVEHIVIAGQNTLYYPTGDSHPSITGSQKATQEFVPLLNVFYNHWKAEDTPHTATIYSVGVQDGWILESSESSGTGGSINSTSAVFRLGDNAQDRQYRAILSFDTNASLPGNAVVTSAILKIRKQGQTGTNPFSTHSSLIIDIRKGAFSGNPALEKGDFQASANGTKAAVFASTATNKWYSARLKDVYLNKINLAGKTQFRLRFTLDDNDDRNADYLQFYSGNSTNQPRLVVTYYVPMAASPSLSFEYLGAFRLPGGEDRPQTFAYGGNAMTFNPDGDPSGAADGFPGSLFIMGHDRMPYGDLPDGNQVAEVNIPAPVTSKALESLHTAKFLQGFHNIAAGHFTELEEIPRVGMQYLNRPETGPKIHLAWGQHLQETRQASHAWFNPTLDTPFVRGEWFIGNQSPYSVNGYLFEIPAAWADAFASGRYLATGRFKDGGWSGMGPALFAYRPWLADGSAPPSGTHLEATTLLLYGNSYTTNDIVHAMNGYQHPDEWEGGAWITTSSGKQAVLFAGTKSNGTKYWYGYLNPAGPAYACVDTQVTDFPTCRTADGGICPPEDFAGCCDEVSGDCASLRGWWSTRFDAQFILYNPADLAKVASGKMAAWEPQPYASLDIDKYLYLNPPEWELQMLGWGDQRRYRIGDVTFDRANGLLYVLELFADGAKPVVHVWRVK